MDSDAPATQQAERYQVYWSDFYDLDSGIAGIGGRHVGSFVFYVYDQVGGLLRRGLIDFDLVDDLLGNSAVQLWEKVGPVVYEARERSDDPRLYEHFEFLHHEMRTRSKAATGP